MVIQVEIEPFLEAATVEPVLDVRTPEEFRQAHIPGAINLPLFSKEERAKVGLAYRKEGRQAAILVGLGLVGPKLQAYIEQAMPAITNGCLVYCWRGGMRSASLAWLLDFYGYNVRTLSGGYKAFRHTILDQFTQSWPFVVLGGKTGSGKTDILYEIQRRGNQILDLEGLANHKGSAFGGLGLPEQPSQEQFENLLGLALRQFDRSRPIWVEDESRHVGRRMIPQGVWNLKVAAPLLFLEIPVEERSAYLAHSYGANDVEGLAHSIRKIERRLGGLAARLALEELERGEFKNVATRVLQYYDQAYAYDLTKRSGTSITMITAQLVDPSRNADLVLKASERLDTL